MTERLKKLRIYAEVAAIAGTMIAVVGLSVAGTNAFRDLKEETGALDTRLAVLREELDRRNIPSSAVIFVDAVSCPEGWQPSARVAGRIIVAADPAVTDDKWGKFGKTGGTADLTFVASVGDDAGSSDASVRSLAINGFPLASGKPVVIENSPPYVTLTACEVKPAKDSGK